MDRYIGIDVHAQSCTVVVLTAAGKKTGLHVLETNGMALVSFIQGLSGQKHVIFEEGAQSEWLYQLFEPHVEEVVVTQPARREGNKSDAKDAEELAEALRLGQVKTRVYKERRNMKPLLIAVRTYRRLMRATVRTKNQLKSVFLARGLAHTDQQLYDAQTRGPWLKKLPVAERLEAELLGDQLDPQLEILKEAEEELEERAKKVKAVQLLMTAPGIGLRRAAIIAAIVVTPHRFRTTRQYWSYCGLGIVTRTSAQWRPGPTGGWIRQNEPQAVGLNRKRNAHLKSVYKGAAKTIVEQMPGHPWAKDFQRAVAAGMRPNLAMLTLSRRIAATTLAMWKKEEVYDLKNHKSVERPTTSPAV